MESKYGASTYDCIRKTPADSIHRDDWQVDIDYYHIDDFPEHLREWALTLFKANMLTM
jgi:hypothetical protein